MSVKLKPSDALVRLEPRAEESKKCRVGASVCDLAFLTDVYPGQECVELPCGVWAYFP